jgi:hypothetical protein
VVTSNQEIAEKLSQTLNAAAQCAAAETSETYAVLGEQLRELETLAERSLRSHVASQALVRKLEDGTALTADELKTIRTLIVGDADYYLKYDDDFDRSKNELGKILDQIRRLQSNDLDLETLMHVGVLCREASNVLAATTHYLEQKERVRRFEQATHGPINADAGRVLARIIKGMMA